MNWNSKTYHTGLKDMLLIFHSSFDGCGSRGWHCSVVVFNAYLWWTNHFTWVFTPEIEGRTLLLRLCYSSVLSSLIITAMAASGITATLSSCWPTAVTSHSCVPVFYILLPASNYLWSWKSLFNGSLCGE